MLCFSLAVSSNALQEIAEGNIAYVGGKMEDLSPDPIL